MAKGAAARGKRVAFGDGAKIIWDINSEQIFRGNPNIAPPGAEGAGDLEWIGFHRGSRIYNKHDKQLHRWIWNYSFRPIPGEVYFSEEEKGFADRFGSGFVVIEPNVPRQKSVAPNKQWPLVRYDAVAETLRRQGVEVFQFVHGPGHALSAAKAIKTPTFRHALAVLARAALYIGPEGGLHHGAAAVDTKAVVIFGGFIPPEVTGYDFHVNLTGGAKACGSLRGCIHCRHAMRAITVDEVLRAAEGVLGGVAA